MTQAPSTTLAQELASHYNADCTALQYLRDRLAGAHRILVTEGTGARPLPPACTHVRDASPRRL